MMPTQEQRDYRFLRGFLHATQEISRRAALGEEGFQPQTPDALATRLQDRGFHRGTQIIETDINRLAQYLYEEGGTSISARRSHAVLVEALTRALKRVDVTVVVEEIEGEVI